MIEIRDKINTMQLTFIKLVYIDILKITGSEFLARSLSANLLAELGGNITIVHKSL